MGLSTGVGKDGKDGKGILVRNRGSPLGGVSSDDCRPSISPFVAALGAGGVGDNVKDGG